MYVFVRGTLYSQLLGSAAYTGRRTTFKSTCRYSVVHGLSSCVRCKLTQFCLECVSSAFTNGKLPSTMHAKRKLERFSIKA